jgi:secreted PhoX family phosphatase
MGERTRTSGCFRDVVARRYSRRDVLQGLAAMAPVLAVGPAPLAHAAANAASPPWPAFEPIRGSREDRVILPGGYRYDVVLRWGDSITPGIPDLDPRSVAAGGLLEAGAARAQEGQFGYNCDAIHFFPLAEDGSRGLICVNNEYTNDELLFPGRRFDDRRRPKAFRDYVTQHPASVRFAQAAHGISVVEIELVEGHWRARRNSPYNRRITGNTPVDLAGPARGAPLLRSSYDRDGGLVYGTLANCAGGRTPWGTYLSGEENLQDYFGNFAGLRARDDVEAAVFEAHRRFWLWEQTSIHGWEFVDPRFDVAHEPTEALRFGWIVELDPSDASSRPRKRTALGRFRHEGANPIVGRDGRVAVYMGDDQEFEYVYKFVSRDRFDPRDRDHNRDLLDHGTLYVARFDADGTGAWLPLEWSASGPLSPETGFTSQADVLIRTRAAADRLGATPMDRPEDLQPDPRTGRIYIALTKNESRTAESISRDYNGRDVAFGPNAANPRGPNPFGHVIELEEEGGEHSGRRFRWDLFLLAGDPSGARLLTRYEDLDPGEPGARDAYYAGQPRAATLSPFGSPDNLGFDATGNLWIVTDGDQPGGKNNGAYVCPTSGPSRGDLRQFMSAPIGAEVCGCEFTPDGRTLFISVQHPGEGGTTETPRSRWPDGDGAAPRPSVIAIRRDDGGRIGG